MNGRCCSFHSLYIVTEDIFSNYRLLVNRLKLDLFSLLKFTNMFHSSMFTGFGCSSFTVFLCFLSLSSSFCFVGTLFIFTLLLPFTTRNFCSKVTLRKFVSPVL